MCLRKMHSLKDSLSVRLTFWYALIFAVSSLLILVIFYHRVAYIAMEGMDQELAEELIEFTDMYIDVGYDHVIREMNREAASEDTDKIFFRLISNSGKVLATTPMESWGHIKVSPDFVRMTITENTPVFDTIDLAHREHQIRSIYGQIGPSLIMQIGLSLEENEEYLHIFKNLVFMLLLPLFIVAALIGWFMAKKALSGVDEVTHIASEISRGAYEKRVMVKKHSNEIDLLANTFNEMVDRLQRIIQEMQEINDNIAHDLRSPLTRIRGAAELTLMSTTSPADFEEMAVSIIEECDNLINMINTMLDIAETEAGVEKLTLDTIDMSKLILDACDLYRSIAREKHITLQVQVPKEKVHFLGDKAKMQRLIANFLDNAIKYTPDQGSVHVTLEDTGGTIIIRFADTGMGIPVSEMPRIFDRFYRGDASRSSAGTGLGLSLAKVIAEAFGGSIHVESALDKGSVFTVTLPRKTTP